MEKAIIKYDGKFYIEKEYYDKIGKLGKVKDKYIELEPEEVLYILKKGWGIVKGKKEYKNFEDFLKDFINSIDFRLYLVLEYLRDIGFYVDILNRKYIILYKDERKDKIQYIILPIYEFDEVYWKDILNHLEFSKKYNAKLLLALIDFEFDIVFYEVSELY